MGNLLVRLVAVQLLKDDSAFSYKTYPTSQQNILKENYFVACPGKINRCNYQA
jgi:hypothetical protein